MTNETETTQVFTPIKTPEIVSIDPSNQAIWRMLQAPDPAPGKQAKQTDAYNAATQGQ